jgi:septation ring formation regulator EzrA
MESHAEIKDKCDGLDSRMDEIAADIRDLPFDYKIVEKYSHIDEEIQQIYEWYEEKKSILSEYLKEKENIENKLKELETHSKHLNNSVQNLKLQAFSRVRHGCRYSQLSCNQHL